MLGQEGVGDREPDNPAADDGKVTLVVMLDPRSRSARRRNPEGEDRQAHPEDAQDEDIDPPGADREHAGIRLGQEHP